MPITFNSVGGFLAGTISSSGNNIFIKTSGSVGTVHLDGDKVLLQSQSAGNTITASLTIEDDNLVINDNLKVKRNEFRFKSADRTKEVKIDVSDNGNIRFKDNDDREIVKFREGGRIDLGQNDTAESSSLTNWNGSISASGFVKVKNTFLGHNYGFPDNFILAHSDRVQNEDFSIEAGRGFAFAQNPAGHTFINAGDGENAGYESINFYQAGLPSSILGKNRNWQFGLGITSPVSFQPPEKLTVEGNISASGTIFADRMEVTQITSSIVTSSIIQTEGSNIIGDAITATQTFNGHITASGDISSSGTITATDGDFNSIDVEATANLDVVDIDGATTFASRTVFEPVTFTASDTSPDVRVGRVFLTNNGSVIGTVTINGFDNGTAGQIIHIIHMDNNTDYTDGTNLQLFRSLDHTTAQTNDTITFVCVDGTKWVELGRSDNT